MVRANEDLTMTGEAADHYAPNVCMYVCMYVCMVWYGMVWYGMI